MIGLVLACPAGAATVQRVNKDSSRVFVALSNAELVSLQPEMQVLFEFGPDGILASGKIAKTDLNKKSVLIVLDQPNFELRRKQELRFLSFFWNPMLSPLHYSLAQYHHYTRSSLESSVGLFTSRRIQTVDATKSQVVARGRDYAAEGYLIIAPDALAADLGFERRSMDVTSSQNDQSITTALKLYRIKPALWFHVYPHIRLALRYDYTALSTTQGAGKDILEYDFSFDEPQLGVVWFDRESEFGILYKHRDRFTASDSQRNQDGSTTSRSETRKMPAELTLHARMVTSPTFLWGAYLGYVFYERTAKKDEPFEPKPEPYEMLRLGMSMEHRLSLTTKLDWRLALDGAKVPDFTTSSRALNTLGVMVSYYEYLSPSFLIGAMQEMTGGVHHDQVDGRDPETGVEGKLPRRGQGYQFRFQFFARYLLDVGDYHARRQRDNFAL